MDSENEPKGRMISLTERSEVREIGTGTLNERSEFSVIVESRDHFLRRNGSPSQWEKEPFEIIH